MKIYTTKKGSIFREDDDKKMRIVFNNDEFDLQLAEGCKIEDLREDLRGFVINGR